MDAESTCLFENLATAGEAIDVAGNESSAPVVLSISIDRTDPVIISPSATPTICPHPGTVFDL